MFLVKANLVEHHADLVDFIALYREEKLVLATVIK